MMDVGLPELLACMALEPEGDGVVRGAKLDIGYHRVFGGQILAQMITAATAAVEGKTVKSMHVAFPREGDAGKSMQYRVTVHHEGRSFATAEILGFQEGDDGERVAAVAMVSLHAAGEGPHHSTPPPDAGVPDDASPRTLDLIPWDIRVVGNVDLADRAAGPPRYEWWMRAPELATLVPTDGRPGSVDQA